MDENRRVDMILGLHAFFSKGTEYVHKDLGVVWLYYPQQSLSDKLLLLGHRSLIKKITQTAVINIVLQRILKNWTFRMLVHIHFQKWPLQFLKTKYIYHKTIEVWNLDWEKWSAAVLI